MNEVWKRIFGEYVASHKAIDTLELNDIVEDGEANTMRLKLLDEIIETMKSEIGE